MAKVRFLMDKIEHEADEGSRMLDVCRDACCSVPFGCGSGVCGTCVTKVVKGEENLSEPGEREKQTLEMFDAKDGHRLMCQCRLKGDVELDSP